MELKTEIGGYSFSFTENGNIYFQPNIDAGYVFTRNDIAELIKLIEIYDSIPEKGEDT